MKTLTAKQILNNSCESVGDGDDKYINITEGLAIEIVEEYAQQFIEELKTLKEDKVRVVEDYNILLELNRNLKQENERLENDLRFKEVIQEIKEVKISELESELLKAKELFKDIQKVLDDTNNGVRMRELNSKLCDRVDDFVAPVEQTKKTEEKIPNNAREFFSKYFKPVSENQPEESKERITETRKKKKSKSPFDGQGSEWETGRAGHCENF